MVWFSSILVRLCHTRCWSSMGVPIWEILDITDTLHLWRHSINHHRCSFLFRVILFFYFWRTGGSQRFVFLTGIFQQYMVYQVQKIRLQVVFLLHSLGLITWGIFFKNVDKYKCKSSFWLKKFQWNETIVRCCRMIA